MSKHVVIVGPEGGAESVPSTLVQDYLKRRSEREYAELERVEAVKARGVVPECCGGAIPVAPARGAFRVFEPVGLYPAGEADHVARPSGYRGRKAMQLADAFDVMEAKAARHGKAAPFTPSQVSMGRHYRDLVERYLSAGVRCSSLESVAQSGGSSGGEFIDAVLRDREEIEMLRRRIGSGAAIVVRRHRPSQRGSRSTIFDQRLVDMVCIEELTMTEILKAHKWSVDRKYVRDLKKALADALDRMG
ncbi:hypothetical protein DS909_06660 [Phaeobacter gallaeciensis]|uniref:Uncharacterized protein n=1 Tax=Phaeobacter gallaeciensis TaxID=60890 RepID=A0A366X803_9RHOB|nr:hypothetical protein [Phaeobacter gallaeciensis]RBW58424.1 hypothetical protein DS909_06660 [Phaeobacter gallaeciensis]